MLLEGGSKGGRGGAILRFVGREGWKTAPHPSRHIAGSARDNAPVG
jgi:hypothetical protein